MDENKFKGVFNNAGKIEQIKKDLRDAIGYNHTDTLDWAEQEVTIKVPRRLVLEAILLIDKSQQVVIESIIEKNAPEIDKINTHISRLWHEYINEIGALHVLLDRYKANAEQANENTNFYRGIIETVGRTFGDEAKTADDGVLQDSVLAVKVPELVSRLHLKFERLKTSLGQARYCINELVPPGPNRETILKVINSAIDAHG
jgi:hypothetical protein